MMQYEYHIIDEAQNKVATFQLEEEALVFVETHTQYTYVKELKPSVYNLERLYNISE